LSETERRHVLAACRRRRFRKHEVVFHEHDAADTLHLVASGRFAVRRTTRTGDDMILRVLGRGAVFGEIALLGDDNRRSATVFALEAGETLSIHRADFDDLRGRHRGVDRFLLALSGDAIRSLSEQVMEALYLSADARLLRRLSMLAVVYDEGQETVTIPLTQQVLAELAGTTRSTTNHTLRALAADGLVELRRGSVIVLDRPALAQRAR
jgi:CRP/FNR family transcriptional regulator, cyclic AMP receptor protein